MPAKKLALIFILALVANWIWENLHSYLYAAYQGGPITGWILFRAALFDAVFITLLAIIFWRFDFLRRRPWLAFVVGLIVAVLIEKWALATHRWAYNELMPLIPGLSVGLTPTIQLALLSYLTYWLVVWR